MKSLIVLFSLLTTSIAMACPARLCAGDRVIYKSNFVGEVVEVFGDGKAKVQFDGSHSGPSIRDENELGKGTQCNGHICVDDRVIDRSNLVGKVIEVFDNGKAEVQLDGSHSGPSSRDVNELGKGVRCIENLCVDNRIIDRSDLVGKVIEVFDNGKAEVQLDGSHSGPSIRSFEELQIER